MSKHFHTTSSPNPETVFQYVFFMFVCVLCFYDFSTVFSTTLGISIFILLNYCVLSSLVRSAQICRLVNEAEKDEAKAEARKCEVEAEAKKFL